MIGPILRVALRAIRTNTLRAALTMLGVIIGVGAVVAMVALGAGARTAVARQVQNLGSNLLLVLPLSPGIRGGQQGLGALHNLHGEGGPALEEARPRGRERAAGAPP